MTVWYAGAYIVSLRHLVYVTLCGRPSGMPDGRPHRVTYTRYRTDRVNSPDDGHMVARNVYRIEINVHKIFVRQICLFTKITKTLKDVGVTKCLL